MEECLNETDYITVSKGDVIGVVLPSSISIPIVSSSTSSEKFIMKHSRNDSPLNLSCSMLCREYETALHLYATIGKSILNVLLMVITLLT